MLYSICSPLVQIDGSIGTSLPSNGIFGQPLDQVVCQDLPTTPIKSGSGTPVLITPTSLVQRSLHYPPSISPTSTTSSEASFLVDTITQREVNTPTMLLDTLNVNPAPLSPRSKRRQSLYPMERQVPSIVTKAIGYLDTKGVKTEGLFRISGAKSRISEVHTHYT